MAEHRKQGARGAREEHGWTYEKRHGELFEPVVATDPKGEVQPEKYFGTGLTQVRHPAHVPVPLYHGTRRDIPDGAQIEPGHPGNFVKRMKHVYMTDQLDEARHYAGPHGRVFRVQPTGWYGHRSDAKGSSWASEDPLDIVEEIPHGMPKKTASDASALAFHHEEWENGGTKWPNAERITARHPEHGVVGALQYLRGSRANSPIYIQRLEVHSDHRRRGYGSALMDTLQAKYPKARIDHGDRTDQGKAWWSSYGQGADRRGRTGTLTSGRTASVCPCGMKVIKDGDEWTHADGSVSHDGRWYGHSVAELMRRRSAKVPTQRLFGPTYGLDHRLFDGEHLKADIRDDIIRHFSDFCERHGYAEWMRWARLFFFGSEASEWTSPIGEGNGDFDLSLGIRYDLFRHANPRYGDLGDEEIARMFTEQMHAELNDPDKHFEVSG